MANDHPKPRKTNRETSPSPKQTPSVHTTFSTNAHIPLDIWGNIKQLLEVLKLDISNMFKKSMLTGNMANPQNRHKHNMQTKMSM